MVWTIPTGRGHEVVVIGPEHCPNRHPLRPPNVLQGADNNESWHQCRTCGLTIHRLHRERTQWVTLKGQPVDVDGFDPHPDTMAGVMLTDRPTSP